MKVLAEGAEAKTAMAPTPTPTPPAAPTATAIPAATPTPAETIAADAARAPTPPPLPPFKITRSVPREIIGFLADHYRNSGNPPSLETMVRVAHGFGAQNAERFKAVLEEPAVLDVLRGHDFEAQKMFMKRIASDNDLNALHGAQVDDADKAVQKLLVLRKLTASQFPQHAGKPWTKYDYSELYEAAKAELAHARHEHDNLPDVLKAAFENPANRDLLNADSWERQDERIRRHSITQRLNYESRNADIAEKVLKLRSAKPSTQDEKLLADQALAELGHSPNEIREWTRFEKRKHLEEGLGRLEKRR